MSLTGLDELGSSPLQSGTLGPVHVTSFLGRRQDGGWHPFLNIPGPRPAPPIERMQRGRDVARWPSAEP